MSTGSSVEIKERVKHATNIVDLVGDYLSLRREGRGFKALCPWHDDSRPSLQVNPERQSFKCWVCDIGGDVFSFVMKMDNLSFPEALARLAERAGIPLTSSGKPGRPGEDKQLLFQAMAWAEQRFHELLRTSPAASAAREYLHERGLSDETIARFHVGFAPNEWEWITAEARGTRFSPPILEAIGLVGRRQNGPGYYDRFRGRVLFSIRDLQGRPVGFGGRVLPGNTDPRAAKYINTPETPLFAKSQLLYGLDVARDAISKSRTAIVTEGYTDCLMAQQAGIANVVAALGTAFGERHLQLLRRYTDRIVLVLDGDEAGRRRSDELLELFISEPVDLRILTLPDNLDPCDFLRARGREAFEELVAGAADALEHKFRIATAGVNAASSVYETNRALESVLGTLAKTPQMVSAVQLKEEQILNRLAARFGVSESSIRTRLTALRRTSRERTAAIGGGMDGAAPTLDSWERELLEIAIVAPECVARMSEEISPEVLTSPAARAILTSCYALVDTSPSLFDRLLIEFDEPGLKSLLVDLDERGRAKGTTDFASRLSQVLGSFRRRSEQVDQQRRTAALAERRADGQTEREILEQIIERERSRHGISVPTDG